MKLLLASPPPGQAVLPPQFILPEHNHDQAERPLVAAI